MAILEKKEIRRYIIFLSSDKFSSFLSPILQLSAFCSSKKNTNHTDEHLIGWYHIKKNTLVIL